VIDFAEGLDKVWNEMAGVRNRLQRSFQEAMESLDKAQSGLEVMYRFVRASPPSSSDSPAPLPERIAPRVVLTPPVLARRSVMLPAQAPVAAMLTGDAPLPKRQRRDPSVFVPTLLGDGALACICAYQPFSEIAGHLEQTTQHQAVLRYLAWLRLDMEAYSTYSRRPSILVENERALLAADPLPVRQLKFELFKKDFDLTLKVFGVSGFRKRTERFSQVMFVLLMTVCSRRKDQDRVALHFEVIQKELFDMMMDTRNPSFFQSIHKATNDPNKIRLRWAMLNALLDRAVGEGAVSSLAERQDKWLIDNEVRIRVFVSAQPEAERVCGGCKHAIRDVQEFTVTVTGEVPTGGFYFECNHLPGECVMLWLDKD
jgi:hypothetical protein